MIHFMPNQKFPVSIEMVVDCTVIYTYDAVNSRWVIEYIHPVTKEIEIFNDSAAVVPIYLPKFPEV